MNRIILVSEELRSLNISVIDVFASIDYAHKTDCGNKIIYNLLFNIASEGHDYKNQNDVIYQFRDEKDNNNKIKYENLLEKISEILETKEIPLNYFFIDPVKLPENFFSVQKQIKAIYKILGKIRFLDERLTEESKGIRIKKLGKNEFESEKIKNLVTILINEGINF